MNNMASAGEKVHAGGPLFRGGESGKEGQKKPGIRTDVQAFFVELRGESFLLSAMPLLTPPLAKPLTSLPL